MFLSFNLSGACLKNKFAIIALMSALKTILWLSVLVAVLPFLGLPQSFDNVLSVLSGAVIFILSFLLRKELGEKEINKPEREDLGKQI